MKKQTPWYFTLAAASVVGILQYLLLGGSKVLVGGYLHSPMIYGSGIHDLGDTVQEVLLVVGMWLKGRKPKGYPFGFKEVDTFVSLSIGLVLVYTALRVFGESCIGLLAQWQDANHAVRAQISWLPAYQPVRVERGLLFPIAGLMALNVMVLLGTSWLQIKVGETNGKFAYIANGKETRSDARTNAFALAGVIIVQLTGWRFVEYGLGIAAAYFIAMTAKEVMGPTIDIMLKKSIGEDVEKELSDILLNVHGVEAVVRLMTYKIGTETVVVSAVIVTRLGSARHHALRYAAERAIRTVILGIEGVQEASIQLTIEAPESKAVRMAYPCVYDGKRLRIVADLSKATHALVCDVVRGDASKGRIRPYKIEGDIHDFLLDRKITQVFVYFGRDRLARGTQPPKHGRFTFTDDPEVELGVKLFS